METPKFQESVVERISIKAKNLEQLMKKLQQTPNELID